MQGLARSALLLKHLSPRISFSDLAIKSLASRPTPTLLYGSRNCSSSATPTLDALYPGSAGFKAGPPPQIKPLYFSGYIPIKVGES